MKTSDLLISSIQELVKTIEQLHADGTKDGLEVMWFRGDSDHQFSLLPGIYRPTFDPEDEEGLINTFYLRAPTLLKRSLMDGWEWLAFIQHYEAPTRLLDWTTSYLTAFFFAVKYW